MSRKSVRKQKRKLALQWLDEQFDVPIEVLPAAANRRIQAARNVVFLEFATQAKRQPRHATKR